MKDNFQRLGCFENKLQFIANTKKKFLRGNEQEIILFETAARELKQRGIQKLPSDTRLCTEMDALEIKKKELYIEYRIAAKKTKEYSIIMQNIDAILTPRQKETEQDHQRE